MRKKLAQAVRKEFDSCLKQRLPKFKSVKPDFIKMLGKTEKGIPLGGRLYLWDFKKDLNFYLMLVLASQKVGDAFTIEGAWTKHNRYPALVGLMNPLDIPELTILHDIPINGDFRFRMSDLYKAHQDHWWWLSPKPSFEEFNKWLKRADFDESPLGTTIIPIEEAINNVKPCVEDVINKITKYVIPYFEKIVERYTKYPGFWEEFQKYDKEKAEKERLLKSKNGLCNEKCIWANCNKKRVKGNVYCIDHLYECGVR